MACTAHELKVWPPGHRIRAYVYFCLGTPFHSDEVQASPSFEQRSSQCSGILLCVLLASAVALALGSAVTSTINISELTGPC